MQKKITLRLSPTEAENTEAITRYIAAYAEVDPSKITGFFTVKKSLDARSRQIWVNLTVNATIGEPNLGRPVQEFHFLNVRNAPKRTVIIGAGPAGLFAALKLIESGIKPIILERGKDVKARRRDLAILNKEGIIHPDSNYCFGEGGAGTYSDGKLYTRSRKRGDTDRILQLFVHFGADEKILYESHPHIGTNKLPQIITAMREQIIASGGEIHFEQRLVDFTIANDSIQKAICASGDQFEGDSFIIATGHSARDIFELLAKKKIRIEAKPFALGIRVEHPQSLIDSIQYHCFTRNQYLPPASYSLVEQVNDKGVFSFCMCPGGIIAPASTSPGELVVNGWSPSKRNNPFANSGVVVEVGIKDALLTFSDKRFINMAGMDEKDPLLLMKLQRAVEEKAFTAGGGKFVAPAARLEDFSRGKNSSTLPDCSYIPGVVPAAFDRVLPPFILERLQLGFRAFGKKMKGYLTNDAIVVATESRTSSPVRIPREDEKLHHPGVRNLYPCGEGAGYAGGIVSAAMDGEKTAVMIAASYGYFPERQIIS
jgi:uncharacterized FAD-dependent dehydrogenase